jgi:single-strand DNA-binding protein
MARSLNKVQLIGNLTRDPELRYTPNGNAVCSFSLATNRNWTTDSGEKREEVDFHRIIAWNKLGELCSQFLVKGRKVYVEGRLTTRTWTGQDGAQKSTTEVIINDMILLDKGGASAATVADTNEDIVPGEVDEAPAEDAKPKKPSKDKAAATGKNDNEESAPRNSDEEVMPDDIPF